MKTKLYILIAGLLMAACATSFGQEIVSEFTIQQENFHSIGCEIFECQDGTLLIGTTSSTSQYLYDSRHTIIKTSPEGETINTLRIDTPDGMNEQNFTNVIERNDKRFVFCVNKDSYAVVSHLWDMTDSTYHVRIILIDTDLNINNDVTVQVAKADMDYFNWDNWLVDSNNDLIVSFWIDNVFHMMRIGLDGTVKNDIETTELFPPTFDYEYHPDTVLWYTGFGIYTESPLIYYKLGCYKTETEHYPIHCYFFDEDFNITKTQWYSRYDENILFNGGNTEHVIPLEGGSYLMSSEMEYPNYEEGCALVKYDSDHNPIGISTQLGHMDYPLMTEMTESGIIYQCHNNFANGTMWLACLDSDLNLSWDIELLGIGVSGFYGNTLLSKANGDIIVGFVSSITYPATKTAIYVYTLHNDPTGVSETKSIDKSFTLYPNPVKDQLTLRFNDSTKPESVELYDLAGRVVGIMPNGMESIDMSALPTGVYMLRITMKDGTCYHEKIMKE